MENIVLTTNRLNPCFDKETVIKDQLPNLNNIATIIMAKETLSTTLTTNIRQFVAINSVCKSDIVSLHVKLRTKTIWPEKALFLLMVRF